MNTSNGNVIHTQGLTKAYQGVKTLDTLNLQALKNPIFGFLGPNGADKSTTIKMLLGLIQPTASKAVLFGRNISKESLAARKPSTPIPPSKPNGRHISFPDNAMD